MRTVLTYGTFDVLHYGHLLLLHRARQLGDRLIVGLSSDEFNEVKGKRSRFDYQLRRQLLGSVRYVDLIIEEKSWEQKLNDIRVYNVSTLVMGDDWDGKFNHLGEYCDVVYLPRTPDVSSTELRRLVGPR